jgi:4-carboxymuconolactone decarboxylase
MKLSTATVFWILLLPAPIAQAQQREDGQRLAITRGGTQPSRSGPVENFTGAVGVQPVFAANEATRAAASYVTFEPGARAAWHTHPRGQTLVVTAGIGRVQRWGGPIDEIRTGDVVWIPPGVKHWHGAAPTSAMTHLAVTEHLDGNAVAWMEKVSDAQYAAGTARSGADSAQPSAAQRLMGDLVPKLAQLTDSVLFGDVWARPQLSRRDRSLATVSALIAMNRPDQLRSHLALAVQNGVTREELLEVITHLAFYAGWPNAVSAVPIAREVLRDR